MATERLEECQCQQWWAKLIRAEQSSLRVVNVCVCLKWWFCGTEQRVSVMLWFWVRKAFNPKTYYLGFDLCSSES